VPRVLSDQLLKIAHQLDEGRLFDSGTESKQISISLDLPPSPPSSLGPLGQRALAKRCGISNGTIGTNKAKYDWRRFAKWIYGYDPDDLHWVFDPSTKKYRVIDYAAALKAEQPDGSVIDSAIP
jgi:hypothetical protein